MRYLHCACLLFLNIAIATSSFNYDTEYEDFRRNNFMFNNDFDTNVNISFKHCPFNPPRSTKEPIICSTLPTNSTKRCLQEPDTIANLVTQYNVPLSYLAFISNAALNKLKLAANYFANIAKDEFAVGKSCALPKEYANDIKIVEEEIGWGRTQLALTQMCTSFEQFWPLKPFLINSFGPLMAFYETAKIARKSKPGAVAINYFKAALGYVAYTYAPLKNSTFAQQASYEDFLQQTNKFINKTLTYRCDRLCNKCCKGCDPCKANTTGNDCGINSSIEASECISLCKLSATRALNLSDIHRTAIMWYSMAARENAVLYKLHSTKKMSRSDILNLSTIVPVTLPLVEALEQLPAFTNWVTTLQLQALYWGKWRTGDIFFADAPVSASYNLNFPRADDFALRVLCKTAPVQAFIKSSVHGKLIQGNCFIPLQQEVLFSPNSLFLVTARHLMPTGKICLYMQDFDYNQYWSKLLGYEVNL